MILKRKKPLIDMPYQLWKCKGNDICLQKDLGFEIERGTHYVIIGIISKALLSESFNNNDALSQTFNVHAA
jgi:hypothetical protein